MCILKKTGMLNPESLKEWAVKSSKEGAEECGAEGEDTELRQSVRLDCEMLKRSC